MQLTMTRELPGVRNLVVPPAPRGLWLLPPFPSLAEELAVSELSAAGASEVGLRVESENIPAVALYRSMGFRPR